MPQIEQTEASVLPVFAKIAPKPEHNRNESQAPQAGSKKAKSFSDEINLKNAEGETADADDLAKVLSPNNKTSESWPLLGLLNETFGDGGNVEDLNTGNSTKSILTEEEEPVPSSSIASGIVEIAAETISTKPADDGPLNFRSGTKDLGVATDLVNTSLEKQAVKASPQMDPADQTVEHVPVARTTGSDEIISPSPENSVSAQVLGKGDVEGKQVTQLGDAATRKTNIEQTTKLVENVTAEGDETSQATNRAVEVAGTQVQSRQVANFDPKELTTKTPEGDRAIAEDGKAVRTEQPDNQARINSATIMPSAPVASSTSEVLQPAIQDVTIDEVEMARAIEATAMKDRSISSQTSIQPTSQLSAAAARQVIGQLSAGLSQIGDGGIEIRLNPVELGRITIQIMEGLGGQSASVSVEKPEVLDLLRKNESLLQNEFKDAGFASMTFSFDQQSDPNTEEESQHQAHSVEQEPGPQNTLSAPAYVRSGADLDIRL